MSTAQIESAKILAKRLISDQSNSEISSNGYTPTLEDNASRVLALARMYERSGLYEEAKLECEKILEFYPDTEAASVAKELLDSLPK